MKKIVILISGNGTNAINIYDAFLEEENIEIVAILTNNPSSKILESTDEFICPVMYIEDINNKLTNIMDDVDLLVLAGYLKRIPKTMTDDYPNKIINIHPSLLPNHGGKGMYGMRVHRAVSEAGEETSGITIHYVNGEYDKGQVILQAKCDIEYFRPEDVMLEVRDLEYKYYPRTIKSLIGG